MGDRKVRWTIDSDAKMSTACPQHEQADMLQVEDRSWRLNRLDDQLEPIGTAYAACCYALSPRAARVLHLGAHTGHGACGDLISEAPRSKACDNSARNNHAPFAFSPGIADSEVRGLLKSSRARLSILAQTVIWTSVRLVPVVFEEEITWPTRFNNGRRKRDGWW